MPPAAMPSSVFLTMSNSSRRRRSSSVEAGGNFGAPPNPPHCGSNLARRPRTASPRNPERGGLAGHFGAPLPVGVRDRLQHLPEARQAVTWLRRVVGAAEERLAVGH